MKISKIIEKTLGSHHFILVIDQRFDIKNINEKLKQK